MLLPVDDAEHQLQVLGDSCSSAALQLLGDTSAAHRAAGVSCLVLHALVRLLRPEDRLATGERHAPPARTASGSSPARARTSARKESMRWSIGFPRRTA
jgi:hypothetical protein